MKIHKGLLLFGISSVVLFACGEENVVEEHEVMFNHGVNADFEIMGDSRNYLNFTGSLADDIDSSQVAVVDVETNIVLGISEVDNKNEFYISTNMQGAGDRDIIFSYDESINIPSVDDIESLDSVVPMYYVENTYVELADSEEIEPEETQEETDESIESENQSESSNNDIFSPGETAYYASGVEISVDSIQITDESPNGEITGNFVRVDFTIDNQTDEELRFTGHDLELYDGDRNKAELNAKNFYSETIAAGMKGSGSAYFDAQETGPFIVMIGAATWQSN